MLKTRERKSQPIRRHVQHLGFVNGVHFFACKSMTRTGLPTAHTQEIDIEDGSVRCSCEHHRFAHAHHEPTLATPDLCCKHIRRGVDWLERHGEMPDVARIGKHRCVHCGMPDADHELCDESGHKVAGHICADCVQRARMMVDDPRETNSSKISNSSNDDDISEADAAPDYEPDEVPPYEPEYSPSEWDEMDARR